MPKTRQHLSNKKKKKQAKQYCSQNPNQLSISAVTVDTVYVFVWTNAGLFRSFCIDSRAPYNGDEHAVALIYDRQIVKITKYQLYMLCESVIFCFCHCLIVGSAGAVNQFHVMLKIAASSVGRSRTLHRMRRKESWLMTLARSMYTHTHTLTTSSSLRRKAKFHFSFFWRLLLRTAFLGPFHWTESISDEDGEINLERYL